MSEYQPYYLAYCRDECYEPDQMLEVDRERWPGGIMCGFILWMNERWREWKQPRGYGTYTVLSDKDREEFGVWLDSYAGAATAATSTSAVRGGVPERSHTRCSVP